MFRSRWGFGGLALAALLTASSARADVGQAAQNQFGSDSKNLENAKLFESLAGPDSHFRLRLGVWFASLGQSLPAKAANDDSIIHTGANDINTGHGALRDIGLSLSVKGNEAFFDYLDNRLLGAADDAVDEHVKNGTAAAAIKQIIGQFKPNLKSILGDHEVSFRVVYGSVRGTITNPDQFVGHDNFLYVPGQPDRTWSSRVFSGEVGVNLFDFEDDEHHECPGTCGFQAYARYTSFRRPQPLTLTSFGGDSTRLTLQDVNVGAYEAGVRNVVTFGDLSSGPSFTMIAGVGGGYAKVDWGSYGSFGRAVLALEAELRLAYAIDLGKLGIGPFASFRYVDLTPFAQPKPPSVSEPGTGPVAVGITTSQLGYALWGPVLGVEGIF